MNLRFWVSYVLRSLRRAGRRPLFATVCVVAGVAAVVALQTASLTVHDALTSNVRASNGGDISVSSQDSPLSRSDLGIFSRLQTRGLISNWTSVASVHATAVGSSRTLVPFTVDIVSVPPYPLGGQPTFVTPSNGTVAGLLRRPGDVLVTSALADELGLKVGDSVTVNSIGGSGLHARIRGILSAATLDRSATMTVTRLDMPVLASGPPQYSAVYANAPGSATAAAAALRQAFPTATVQTVAEALQANEQEVHDFQQFLLLAGLLTLLIAGVGILNAMQSMLASRRLEIAMLKTLGFRPGVLYALFGGEALVIGVVGGLTGSVVGAVASDLITSAVARAVGVQVNASIDAGTLAGGVALGAVATLIFAVLPIVQSAGLRPLEVLRPSEGGRPVSRLPQTVGLLILLVILFSALAASVVDDWVLAVQFVVGAFVACAVMTGLFALIVTWISRLGRPSSIGWGIAVLGGLVLIILLFARRQPALAIIAGFGAVIWACTLILPERRLFPLMIAARSLSRRRSRTSVTLVAFLAGILCLTLTLTIGLTLQSQISSALASANAVNMVAVANAASRDAVLRESARLPGVKSRTAVTSVETRPLSVNGRPLVDIVGPASSAQREDDPSRWLRGVTGYHLSDGMRPASIGIVAGRMLTATDAGSDHVLVNADLRGFPYDLQLGDRITLRDPGSGIRQTGRVVGFYTRPRGLRRRTISSLFTQPVLADQSLVQALGPGDAQTVVSFAVNSSDLSSDSTALQRRVPGALVLNISDLTAVVRTILNDLLNVLVVITALAMSAGLAVIGTSVTLSMFERYREIALYKAIGFGPRSVLSFVLVENALGGLVAGAIGVVVVAIALSILSRVALQTPIAFDPVLALIVVGGAMGLAVLTAYLMARRPITVRPLDALRNE